MDIGEPVKTTIIEPIVSPIPNEIPAVDPDFDPLTLPEKEEELIPV